MPEVRDGAFGVLLKVILLHNPDLKQEAILHGIQGAACTFACVWCLAARQDRKRRDGYKTREGFKFPPRTRECLLRDSARLVRLRSFADPKQTDVFACHSQMGEPLAATFMSSRHPGELHHRTGLCTRCLEIAERTIKSKCRDKEGLQEAERSVYISGYGS